MDLAFHSRLVVIYFAKCAVLLYNSIVRLDINSTVEYEINSILTPTVIPQQTTVKSFDN